MFYKPPKRNMIINLANIAWIRYNTVKREYYTDPGNKEVLVYEVLVQSASGMSDSFALDANQFADFLQQLNLCSQLKYGISIVSDF